MTDTDQEAPAPRAILGSRDDVIWLAGLLEGEGTFDAHRGKYPRIRLAMTDRDVVGRAASLMGCRIRLSLKRAPAASTWHAELSGPRAAAIMAELLPYLGTRRSGRMADVIAIHHYRTAAESSKSAPGPEVGRPLGIAKPLALTA
jgi:hypothetical protein